MGKSALSAQIAFLLNMEKFAGIPFGGMGIGAKVSPRA